jgi:hypothetical protein
MELGDKYLFHGLVKNCKKFLDESIENNNVMHILDLILNDRIKDKEIQEKCDKIIKKNTKSL